AGVYKVGITMLAAIPTDKKVLKGFHFPLAIVHSPLLNSYFKKSIPMQALLKALSHLNMIINVFHTPPF
ncbi:hypothetical protein V7075_23785, partial [Neobacillus drentensis]|uniref:hypothetical protein n=1 Tax=Neobacillus drentensis TaxID=220684 RepID=UPI0030002523